MVDVWACPSQVNKRKISDDNGSERKVLCLSAPNPSPGKKPNADERDSDEPECDFLCAAPAIVAGSAKDADEADDDDEEDDESDGEAGVDNPRSKASRKRKAKRGKVRGSPTGPNVKAPKVQPSSAAKAPKLNVAKQKNVTKLAAARHKDFQTTMAVVTQIEDVLKKAESSTLVKMMSHISLVALEKKLAARSTCELLRTYMDEQLASAQVDFDSHSAADGRTLVDTLVDLSPKLSAVKNLVRCLNPSQRDSEARERVFLHKAIATMTQAGLPCPDVAVMQYVERVIDESNFLEGSAVQNSISRILCAAKPSDWVEGDIGLWNMSGDADECARAQQNLVVRCLQVPLAAAKKDKDDAKENLKDDVAMDFAPLKSWVAAFAKEVHFKSDAAKIEFQHVANVFDPESCETSQALAESLAAVAANKKSAYFATLNLYCWDQIKHCNNVVEALALEKSTIAQLQALHSEVQEASADDAVVMQRWKVYRLRLSDLISGRSQRFLAKSDVKSLVSEVDAATLKVFINCRTNTLTLVLALVDAPLRALCDKQDKSDLQALAGALNQEAIQAAMQECASLAIGPPDSELSANFNKMQFIVSKLFSEWSKALQQLQAGEFNPSATESVAFLQKLAAMKAQIDLAKELGPAGDICTQALAHTAKLIFGEATKLLQGFTDKHRLHHLTNLFKIATERKTDDLLSWIVAATPQLANVSALHGMAWQASVDTAKGLVEHYPVMQQAYGLADSLRVGPDVLSFSEVALAMGFAPLARQMTAMHKLLRQAEKEFATKHLQQLRPDLEETKASASKFAIFAKTLGEPTSKLATFATHVADIASQGFESDVMKLVAKAHANFADVLAPLMTPSVDITRILDGDGDHDTFEKLCAPMLKTPDVKAFQKAWQTARPVREIVAQCTEEWGEKLTILLGEETAATLDRASLAVGSLMLVQAMWGKAASAMTPKDKLAAIEHCQRVLQEDGLRTHPKLSMLCASLKQGQGPQPGPEPQPADTLPIQASPSGPSS